MALNWRELENLLQDIRPIIEGSIWQKFVQASEPGGGDLLLVFGFSSLHGPYRLALSAHMDACFASLLPADEVIGKNLPASTFIMVARKYLLGSRVRRVVQPSGERIVRVEFESGKVLLLELIPRRANFVIVEDWHAEERWGRYLGSFRQVSLEAGGRYSISPSQPYEPKEVRAFTDTAGETLDERVTRFLLRKVRADSFERQRNAVLSAGRAALKKLHVAMRNAEADAAKLGKADSLREQALALSAALYSLGPRNYPAAKRVEVPSLDGEAMVMVEVNPQRTFSENSELLFTKIKKLARAQVEFDARGGQLRKKIGGLESLLQGIEAAADADVLEQLLGKLERFGVKVQKLQKAAAKRVDKEPEAKDFLEVNSSDGFRILCGRNQIENRKVTFQASASSDLWLHLKGAPGSHVVIKAQKKKTFPLATLLEAAQLCLFYSKVKKGKRVDVDYTLRKNVRAIKGTAAEVTYTDNKTLYVEADPEVVKRLLREEL